MSKVYEALRQKEQERDEQPVSVGVIGTLPGLELFSFHDETLSDSRVRRMTDAAVEDSPEEIGGPDVLDSAISEPRTTPAEFSRATLPATQNPSLVFHSDPHGSAAEQFRFLRRNLEQKFPGGAVLLVTSPAPKDGKTFMSLNLSACLADSGRSTLLLEADIRQPSIGKVVGENTSVHGIEEALAGTVEPREAIRFFPELSLCVATVVTPPADPARVIVGLGAKHLMDWARQQFHWVVIDSPPLLSAADTAQILPLADSALLVVRAHSTPRDLAARSFELLGDRLFGVVLNEATRGSSPYYRYVSDPRAKTSSHAGNPAESSI